MLEAIQGAGTILVAVAAAWQKWSNRRLARRLEEAEARVRESNADLASAQATAVGIESLRGVVQELTATLRETHARRAVHTKWDDEMVQNMRDLDHPWTTPPPL